MKTRVISAAVGLALLAVVMVLFDTIAVNIALTAIGGLAVYEVAKALKLDGKKVLYLPVIAFALLYFLFELPDLLFVYVTMFVMFCVVMFSKDRHYLYKEGAAFAAAAILIVLGLGSILKMRALFANNKWDAVMALLFGLATGWLCDTFAYTFGCLFGKRKMCPSISPNKTIAGGIGGVAGTPVCIALIYVIYALNAENSVFYGTVRPGTVLFFFAMGAVGAVLGIIGDLAASYIKRECGVKDFGNIMPGHGGAYDRIDSVLFTCVFTYFCLSVFVKYVI